MLLYFTILVKLQQNNGGFEVEEGMRGAWFSQETGTEDTSGVIVEDVSSVDATYDWINKTIVQPVFVDSICGDGICDEGTEHQYW
jgi:hypothetical protein